jgi:hypothetical protein
VIAQVRTASALQGSHGQVECAKQSIFLVNVELARGSSRIDAGAKKNLIGEQVAHPRHDRLIEQASLDCPSVTARHVHDLVELLAVKRERVRTKLA